MDGEQIQRGLIELTLLLQKLSPGQLRGLCQFINTRSPADINFSLINDLLQRSSPQQLEQLIQASSKLLHLDQENFGEDKNKSELQQFAQIYHLYLLTKLLSDLNQSQWMKVFDLLVITPGTQQVEQLQILGEIQQLLAQLHPETLQSLRSELEDTLKKEPQNSVIEVLSQLIHLQSDHFYLYQPLSLLLQTPSMADLLHLQEVVPRWEPIQLIQVTRLADVGMFDAMNLREILCGKEQTNNNNNQDMDIDDEGDDEDAQPPHTLQLQFIEQPPEKCVYKRNVKPPPVLMVAGEQGPNDGNLYIIVNLIRCDTFQEAPTLLNGNKPVKVTANRVIPFKKLKIMSTSHQLNETLFSLRFELRRYNGDEYETLHTITSDPICVLSHSTQLKQTNKDLPLVAEVIPLSGPPSGYTRVVVLGANFADSPTTRVKFDDIEVMPIFHGPKTLICHTPKHEPGTVKVTVCNDAKKWSDSAGTFTYDSAIEQEQDQEAVSLDQQFKLNIADSIWEAAFEGGFDSIRILTQDKQNEPNIDMPDQRGYTALHYSAAHGYDNITGLLLEHNARLDCTDPRQGNTPMHWAAQNGHQSTIGLMLKHEQGQLLRQLKIARGGNTAGCRFNSVINFQNFDGNSPLHVAAVEGQSEIVKALVTAGAQINLPNLEGLTPLFAAIQAGRADIAQFLIRNGAFVNQQDVEGDTPLHWAIRHGQYQMLNLLLDQGAGCEFKNSDGETPLILAASINDDMMVRLIISRGGNVEAQDKSGLNALHWAVMSQSESMTRMLLDSAPRRQQLILAQDKFGSSALSLAYMYGNARITSMFTELVGTNKTANPFAKEEESCRSSLFKVGAYQVHPVNTNGFQLVTPMLN